jgi:hypothetical protein
MKISETLFYSLLYFFLFLLAAEILAALWKFTKPIRLKLLLGWYAIRHLFLKKVRTQSEPNLAQSTKPEIPSDFITLNDLAQPTSVKPKYSRQGTQRKRDKKGRFIKN